MKILTSFIVLLISFSTFAQAPDRFIQNYFFPPNSSSQSYGVANTNYGYMLAGMSIDSAGAWGYTVSGVD